VEQLGELIGGRGFGVEPGVERSEGRHE